MHYCLLFCDPLQMLTAGLVMYLSMVACNWNGKRIRQEHVIAMNSCFERSKADLSDFHHFGGFHIMSKIAVDHFTQHWRENRKLLLCLWRMGYWMLVDFSSCVISTWINMNMSSYGCGQPPELNNECKGLIQSAGLSSVHYVHLGPIQ